MPRRKPAARRPSRQPAKEAMAEPSMGEEEAKGPQVGQTMNVGTAKRRDTGQMSVEKGRLMKNVTHLVDRLTQPSVGVKTLATARWGESI